MVLQRFCAYGAKRRADTPSAISEAPSATPDAPSTKGVAQKATVQDIRNLSCQSRCLNNPTSEGAILPRLPEERRGGMEGRRSCAAYPHIRRLLCMLYFGHNTRINVATTKPTTTRYNKAFTSVLHEPDRNPCTNTRTPTALQ
jgi:hypothetical protein